MSLLSRLEPKLGRFAVPNITVMFICGQVLLYVAATMELGAVGGDVLENIRLYPARVLDGEYWRLITFLFEPPGSNPVFAFIFWYLFYLFGTTLEESWGTFRYNVFLLIGYIASVATVFAVYFWADAADLPASSTFLYGTVFLAFARLYPDFVLQIFFVLPVKVKWLALLQLIGYAITFLFGTWMEKAMVAASLANYLLFFGRDMLHELRHGHRRMQFQSRVLRGQQRIVHKCRICGLTSDDAPQAQFRYCSKCDGDCCYCDQHLRDHEHIRAAAQPTVGES